MKNVFDGLISKLDMTETKICDMGDMPIKTSKTEMQRKKRRKPEPNI